MGRLRSLAAVCFVILLVINMCLGCGSNRPPAAALQLSEQYAALRAKVITRQDSTKTASFRLRWKVREVEPHSDLILRIDYRSPASYHVVGKGPMDVPVFTGWVIDSNYVLVLHREQETLRGHLRDLHPEEFTLDIRPFGGFLELFAGGVSAFLPREFSDVQMQNPGLQAERFTIKDGAGRQVMLDLQRARIREITWHEDSGQNNWVFAVEYGGFSRAYPFWRLKRAHWENLSGPGRYDWEVLAEKYNPDLANRLFHPPGPE